MNWVEHQGVYFNGSYRCCRSTNGEWSVWLFAENQNGVLKRGFQNLNAAKLWAEQHEFHDESLLKRLDAVSAK